MPRRQMPPSPLGRSLQSWATELTGYLIELTTSDEGAPRIVILAHKVGDRAASAKAAGAVMYDPVGLTPVVANGAEWERIVLAPVLTSAPQSAIVSATSYAATPTAAELRTLALALQEVISRLNAIERR